MKKIFFLSAIILLQFFASCIVPPVFAENIKIVNWNIQTFFDGITDGTEYSDFKGSSWSQEKYEERLKRLCSSIERINADIFIFEEIENDGVLYDISNQLSGNIWSRNKYWPFACFRKNPGDSIGCGILSRYPVNSVKVHNLDIRSENEKQPSMRSLMEISLCTKYSGDFTLLVNHWKSKSSGEEESEVWRNWQETVLSRYFIKNRGKRILAAGDFNRNISEFEAIKSFSFETNNHQNMNLRDFVQNERISVFSPWINETGTLVNPGSYYYRSNWERIDHFFASPELAIKTFYPLTDGPWCNSESQVPSAYKIYSGYGYSDHLPIFCEVEF